MPHLRLSRFIAGAATGALLTTVLVGPAQADRADDAGGWLEGQLTNSLVHNDQFNVDDYGLTLDFGFGLKALGGHGATVRAIRDEMTEHVASYTTDADFGPGKDRYAGPIAKLAAYAQATGADPRDYGGTDLIKQLNARVANKGPIAGRIRDKGASDFANTIGQAYAARALKLTGSRKAGRAIRFLLKQQCAAGFFRLNFAAPGAKKQSCDAAPKAKKAPDTDVTALAVINLRAIPFKQRSKAVKSAINDATAWLKKKQKKNGSFGGGTSTEKSNANSTGLAGWALGDSGACRPAARAARWVRNLQVPPSATAPLDGEVGAIAYDRAGYNAGEDGIDNTERDQWRRTSAQAGPALGFLRVADCT
jgi:hypothetical protein